MPHKFTNTSRVTIRSDGPHTVSSSVQVDDLPGEVARLAVDVDIAHTATIDLTIRLIGPMGRTVRLVRWAGRAGENYEGTEFRDDAPRPISAGSPPFRGPFRPEQPLQAFDGDSPNGEWLLEVEDDTTGDGGSLNRWSLTITTDVASSGDPVDSDDGAAELERPFPIELDFAAGFTPTQREIIGRAAAKWERLFVGSLPAVQSPSLGQIDGIYVRVNTAVIDQAGLVLADSTLSELRPGSLLVAVAEVRFDAIDLAELEQDDGLFNVALHELGHALGHGFLWEQKNLVIQGANGPEFIGPLAIQEYQALGGATGGGVPLEDSGGVGTHGAHWRESIFEHELMSSALDVGENPLSRLTVAALRDLGYPVSIDRADNFALQNSVSLAARSVRSECCAVPGRQAPNLLD